MPHVIMASGIPMTTSSSSSPLRFAMLGMTEGNGHPYSWSAIFNGYDKEAMSNCPFAGIPAYLGQQPESEFREFNARITHVWTDDPADAPQVSRASLVPNVVERAEDVIGQVDGVLIATDIGYQHVERARPFIEAGLPVFIDKPMCDNEADLKTFVKWYDEGAKILSSSGLRYTKEFLPYRLSTRNLGDIRFASITTCKSWEKYGIHALEGMYPVFGPGFISARNTGTKEQNVVHLKHECGADIVVAAHQDMLGGLGVLSLCGTQGYAQAKSGDTFYAFKAQMRSFVDFVQTGQRPFPFTETIELMKLVIAGIRSRDEDGREVFLSEISER